MRWLMVGVLAAVAVVLYALFHAIFAPASKVRSLPKGVWILAIILLPVIGAGLWFWLGAPRVERRASPLRPVQRGLGPDDDPEFLRRLETQRRQKEREARLSEREAELKRHERDVTGQTSDPSGIKPGSKGHKPGPTGEAAPKQASTDQNPATPDGKARHPDADSAPGHEPEHGDREDLEDPSGGPSTDPRPGPTSPAND